MKKKNKTTHKHHSCVHEILGRVPDYDGKGHGSTTTSSENAWIKKDYNRSRGPKFYCLNCGGKEFTEPEVEITITETWISNHRIEQSERENIDHGKCKKCGQPFDPAEFYKHQAELNKTL